MSLLHDRISPTKHFNEKLLLQQQFQIQLAFTKNPSASASEYAVFDTLILSDW